MLLWHPWWCLYCTEKPCPWCPEAGGPEELEKLDWSCPPGPWKGSGPKTGDPKDPWWQPWDADVGPTQCGWFIGCAPIALDCMPWKGEPGVQGCCPGRAPWGWWGDHVDCHIAQRMPREGKSKSTINKKNVIRSQSRQVEITFMEHRHYQEHVQVWLKGSRPCDIRFRLVTAVNFTTNWCTTITLPK